MNESASSNTMSNRFTLGQAIARSDKRVLDGYEVDRIPMFMKDGKTLHVFDMEEHDQPNRTFDGEQVIELTYGRGLITDVDGKIATVAFYETIPLTGNTEPVPGQAIA